MSIPSWLRLFLSHPLKFLKIQKLRLESHLKEFSDIWFSRIIYLPKGTFSSLVFDLKLNPDRLKEKQEFLHQSSNSKFIFFVFRGRHWVDWFIPVDKALLQRHPEITVLYVNFSGSMAQIGKGKRLLEERNAIEARLNNFGIDRKRLFFAEELGMLKKQFPQSPSAIVSTESVKAEQFNCRNRVYLPHYFILKPTDRPPLNGRYNHVCVPSKAPYFYPKLEKSTAIKSHLTGMPKMRLRYQQRRIPEASGRPVVLFAPSLDSILLKNYVENDIFRIFSEVPECLFLVKPHPSLFTMRDYLAEYFCEESTQYANISVERSAAIQELYEATAMMIADFGSSGAEYKLGAGKPVIFIKVPPEYESESLSLFKDKYADDVQDVRGLGGAVKRILTLPAMQPEKLVEMRTDVLYGFDDADAVVADTLAEIVANG